MPASISGGAVDTAPIPVSGTGRSRLDSIDLLRGIVMVVMVLDHTRDFVHGPALHWDPTDLTRTTLPIFMTRWITHFCAPVFVLLAGVSVSLQTLRGRRTGELSRFLVTRGIWLLMIEIVVLHVLVWFTFDFSFIGPLQVIWALGWSMIVLAGLIHLPRLVVAAFGVGIIALHNIFDGVRVSGWTGADSLIPSGWAKGWMVLHQQGLFPLLGDTSPLVWLQYPLIPWVGLMAVGYAFGEIYGRERHRRVKWLWRAGLLLTGAFIVARAVNIYGDPSPWSVQRNALFTVISFINTTKYPASLLYLLMTLGPALMALSWFESRRLGEWGRPLIVFGRVPLFFYLIQWPLAHGAGIVANLVAGTSVDYMFLTPPAIFNAPLETGFPLWVVYVCWACIILVEYPICVWFAGVKQRRCDWWLSYL